MMLRPALLLFLSLWSGSALASSDVYLKHYGIADETTSTIRAQAIFKQVYSAADQRKTYQPRLTVLKADPGGPAVAFADGNILLGQPSLEELYEGVSQQAGDTRLAFLLGHELAHYAEGHFVAAADHNALAKRGLTAVAGASNGAEGEQFRQKELNADRQGLIAAALAGFEVTEIVAENGFLTQWVSRYDTQASEYAPAVQRANYLRQHLQQVLQELELYRFGVQLALLGRCEEAQPLFMRFRRVFPSREVLFNQGACALQLALQAMPPALATQYWLPLAFDSASLLDPVAQGSSRIMRDAKYSPSTRGHLEAAETFLKLSAQQDSSYWQANLMLAVVQWLLKKPYQARSSLELAASVYGENADIEGMRLLILADSMPHDSDSKTDFLVNGFKRLLAAYPEASGWRFNYANLMQKKAPADASPHWGQLLKATQQFTHAFQSIICQHGTCMRRSAPYAAISLPSEVPELGRDLYEAEIGEKPTITAVVGGTEVSIYNVNGHTVSALDGIVEMISVAIPTASAASYQPSEMVHIEGLRGFHGIRYFRADKKLYELERGVLKRVTTAL